MYHISVPKRYDRIYRWLTKPNFINIPYTFLYLEEFYNNHDIILRNDRNFNV